ncbi:DUF4817 domain-containing protein [Trichonephila clavipes]|nr:DUF4817 domain-containing protein [Trichonephila clavipes]
MFEWYKWLSGRKDIEEDDERDEAHFWLNGYVNKQNCRIWSEASPQVYVETPLHPEKLTVWCALWAGGIIGPYFFKNDEGHNELWFQQDRATCHTARATIDLLKDTFDDRLISRFGPVNWPPRSCDLTPLDYFLWGYVISQVYADKPQTLDHLEDNIRRVIADIRPQMLEKVIENWTSRLDYIRASRGSPMPEILFKISTISNKTVSPNKSDRVKPVSTPELTKILKQKKYYTKVDGPANCNSTSIQPSPYLSKEEQVASVHIEMQEVRPSYGSSHPLKVRS